MLLTCRFNGEVGDVVVGRITEVRSSLLCDNSLKSWSDSFVILYMFAGATEAMEGGDQLSAGLCPPVVCCQPPWRRTGEVLLLSSCRRWKHGQGHGSFMVWNVHFFSLLEEKISRRWAHHERVSSRGWSHQCNSVHLYLGYPSFHFQLRSTYNLYLLHVGRSAVCLLWWSSVTSHPQFKVRQSKWIIY